MMDRLDEMLDAYHDHFGENFPYGYNSRYFGWADEDIASEIKRCIETDTPALPPYNVPGIVY